jgi:hypothetical protein
MADCCAAEASKRASCPDCGQTSLAIGLPTLLLHLQQPWDYADSTYQHYFCAQHDCPVVYFNQAGGRILQQQLRTRVGQKSTAPERTLCYCYGISYAQAASDPALKAFVRAQTAAQHCACDSRNPSGRCCLKGFPKQP